MLFNAFVNYFVIGGTTSIPFTTENVLESKQNKPPVINNQKGAIVLAKLLIVN